MNGGIAQECRRVFGKAASNDSCESANFELLAYVVHCGQQGGNPHRRNPREGGRGCGLFAEHKCQNADVRQNHDSLQIGPTPDLTF